LRSASGGCGAVPRSTLASVGGIGGCSHSFRDFAFGGHVRSSWAILRLECGRVAGTRLLVICGMKSVVCTRRQVCADYIAVEHVTRRRVLPRQNIIIEQTERSRSWIKVEEQ